MEAEIECGEVMNSDQIDVFQHVLETIMERSTRAWVYLPSKGGWNLKSESATLESDEIPPELEDSPGAGIPRLAIHHDLAQIMPVSTVQEIVSNVRAQKPIFSTEDIFRAFTFYYERDAFMRFV